MAVTPLGIATKDKSNELNSWMPKHLRMVKVEQTKFNSIMIIGCIVTLIGFGGTVLSSWIAINSRMAVMEYKLETIIDVQRENTKVIQNTKPSTR